MWNNKKLSRFEKVSYTYIYYKNTWEDISDCYFCEFCWNLEVHKSIILEHDAPEYLTSTQISTKYDLKENTFVHVSYFSLCINL